MKIAVVSFSLMLAMMTVLLSGCAPAPTPVPATFTPSPLPPTRTPTPTFTSTPPPTENQPMENKLQQLITVEEITELSAGLGIVEWKLDEETTGKSRICRTFLGQSWSVSKNVAINCIWKVASGITFTEAIQWLKDSQIIPTSASSLESSYDYDGDFALYTYLGSNGHSVYDSFLLMGNLLYWASIDFGMSIGYSPESFYDENSESIDSFLHEVLTKNLTTGK